MLVLRHVPLLGREAEAGLRPVRQPVEGGGQLRRFRQELLAVPQAVDLVHQPRPRDAHQGALVARRGEFLNLRNGGFTNLIIFLQPSFSSQLSLLRTLVEHNHTRQTGHGVKESINWTVISKELNREYYDCKNKYKLLQANEMRKGESAVMSVVTV